MNKLRCVLLAFFFLLFVFLGISKVFAQEVINISVNPSIIKNEDFAQILGGYIAPFDGLSADYVISEAKKMFPQPPEFPVPAVMRTQSYHMLGNDYFAMTDAWVEETIRFCAKAGCDPMFGALGEGAIETKNLCTPASPCMITGKVIDVSAPAILRRAQLVKDKCRQYFGDDTHCRHWDIGNEPPRPDGNCEYYASVLIPTAIRTIKQVMPNAIFHAPELFSETAKVKGSEETVGECIIGRVNEIDPSLKIDVVTTHWYPYNCSFGGEGALDVDGNAILKWNGFGTEVQKMTYPFNIVNTMKSWMGKYSVSKNSVIGIGELNTMADCRGVDEVTEKVNQTWGGAFWHLDILGIAANAGIKYIQKHIHIRNGGGTYEAIVIGQGKVYKQPPYYAYRFYSQFFGRKVVESVSNNPETVSSYASLDKDGNIRLLLINKSGSGFKSGVNAGNFAAVRKVKISIANFNPASLGESFRMTANFLSGPVPAIDPKDDESFYQRQSGVAVGNNFEYEIPAYSAVILKIPTNNPSPIITSANSRTCSINLSEDSQWENDGKWLGVSVSGKGVSGGNDSVRLWVERKNGQAIEGIKTYFTGVNTISVPFVISQGRSFYLLNQCASPNGSFCSFDIKVFLKVPGDYYFHCDSVDSALKGCSGNPFCAYEGGATSCGDYYSCSGSDNVALNLSPVPTQNPSCACPAGVPVKYLGNANCDDFVDGQDFEIWREESRGLRTTTKADFNCANGVDQADFEIWKLNRSK